MELDTGDWILNASLVCWEIARPNHTLEIATEWLPKCSQQVQCEPPHRLCPAYHTIAFWASVHPHPARSTWCPNFENCSKNEPFRAVAASIPEKALTH